MSLHLRILQNAGGFLLRLFYAGRGLFFRFLHAGCGFLLCLLQNAVLLALNICISYVLLIRFVAGLRCSRRGLLFFCFFFFFGFCLFGLRRCSGFCHGLCSGHCRPTFGGGCFLLCGGCAHFRLFRQSLGGLRPLHSVLQLLPELCDLFPKRLLLAAIFRIPCSLFRFLFFLRTLLFLCVLLRKLHGIVRDNDGMSLSEGFDLFVLFAEVLLLTGCFFLFCLICFLHRFRFRYGFFFCFRLRCCFLYFFAHDDLLIFLTV